MRRFHYLFLALMLTSLTTNGSTSLKSTIL